MDKENGDDYIRRIASFIKTNEGRLADAVAVSRRRPLKPSSSSVLGWIGLGSTEQPKKPLIFTDDPHHLFYLLMRFEALGIDVGSLDVRVQNPSRPNSMSYIAMLALKDKSDVLSVSSFRSSMSSVSMFSLGGSWFGRTQPTSIDSELKYLYSAFTKIPALRVCASGLKVISELANDPPTDSAIPMESFKNLQILECCDIDPRTLMGWDNLSLSLKSLTIKRSGLEDMTDLFFDSVVDDKARREGSPIRVARPRLVHRPPSVRLRQSSFHSPTLPASVPEDAEEAVIPDLPGPPPERLLPPYAWSLLTYLSLSDNSLTFLPSLPPLPRLFSLDVSSNLLVSIPPCLSSIPTLKSLNLAHNMIDSVLGIYSQIPSIVSLNLASNRLDSLCGLERLTHLSRVDLRDNNVEDTDEVGRLAVLHDIREVWFSGNPCAKRDENWRIRSFDLFSREGREILLDGSTPGIMERQRMSYQVEKNTHNSNGRPLSIAHSPSTVPVDGQRTATPVSPPQSSVDQQTSPLLPGSPTLSVVQSVSSTTPKQRKRRKNRIVHLDDMDSTDESGRETRPGHARYHSDVGVLRNSPEHHSKPTRDPSQITPSSTDKLAMPQPQRSTTTMAESPATISRARHESGTALTLSSAKSAKRRARLSASVYEPGSASQMLLDPSSGPLNGGTTASEADVFRKRIEALRNEVGDSWLKVLSQTQMGSPEREMVRNKS